MPYSQLADMITHLDSLGVTNYQALFAGGCARLGQLAFGKDQALAFLAAGFAGVPPPPPLPRPPPGDFPTGAQCFDPR